MRTINLYLPESVLERYWHDYERLLAERNREATLSPQVHTEYLDSNKEGAK